jgi:hypothetical protein
MTEEQEWCLHCGAAVGTRVVAARGWRTPFAVAGVILALAALALAVAIVQLADDTDRVTQPPPAAVEASPAPPPAATPVPTATPDPALTPEATATPEATSAPDTGGAGAGEGADAAEWPAGKSGWTVVLSSDTTRSAAERKARQFADDGVAGVGVLRSDDFSSLKGGFWVVFAGEYDSQSAASDALDGIDARDAYIRRIVPN